MPELRVFDSIKMIRETLCVAQSRIVGSGDPRAREHMLRLQRLINECDRHRPLGPDGKHGNLHTPTCGCERRNPHCSNCGDTRGGPMGHEISECTWRRNG